LCYNRGLCYSFFYQLDAQILYFNRFITFLYMFRALLCSSSGGDCYFFLSRLAVLKLKQACDGAKFSISICQYVSMLLVSHLTFRKHNCVITGVYVSLFFTNLMHKFFILMHLVYSCTCFEHYCAHLQEDNCINTASGIVTLFR